uniref:Putative polycomb group RING finger protein 6-like n=1 Tax=Solanum chacoense TaxID=4108 RepID=A0A0V0HQG5_SOLCH
MDSITTTHVPTSDIPINQGNNRSINRRLSARFPSSKDATYPDDIGNEFGSRNRTLNRNASKAQRGSPSTKFDPSMSMRRSGTDGECEEDESSEEEEEENEEESAKTKEGEEPVRMSLMALLAESEGSSYMMGEDEDEEDEDDGGGDVGGDNLNNCCVCQVRHKGAAFVPCGHSFCRLCSRELWVEGANCPLCNNFILEILDIF